ncbi:hypothetical protein LKV13_01545 [Borrelia sp. BU AG58]|uniref:hypothetical protein n=1 Tax=Borrelia sp. BU AG58 TaxID=2887345 RepID=UPI001E638884|nr:hypothetical protein [Borrelia sp. BU AG58]UER67494.1 hypothetical protein LKV13_01545 [Borrelia sp. BU AG58]
MRTIFLFLFTFSNLHPFLEFGKGEKFDLVRDFGELVNDDLCVGIGLKAIGASISIFSNNYKVLYSKNKEKEYDRSILIVFDKDLALNLEFFGDFVYKNGRIFFINGSRIFDVVVVDHHRGQIINPLFVIKNRGNLTIDTPFVLGSVLLKGKDDAMIELQKNINLDVEFGSYGLVLNFSKENINASSSLKGIYYFEVFLNNKSVFRAKFQSILLNDNSYVISGINNHDSSFSNIKGDNGVIEVNNLEFAKGKNEITIKYGDVYGAENRLTYRFVING